MTPELADVIADQDMFCLATATADGQPCAQYRSGLPGFLKVLDDHTLGFADFGGNRQYLTVGNLSENPKAPHVPDGLREPAAGEGLGGSAGGGGGCNDRGATP